MLPLECHSNILKNFSHICQPLRYVKKHVHLVAEEGSRESVDAKCRRLTATWVRERRASDQDIEVCDFYEQLERAGSEALLEPGVYTMQDLRIFGRKQGWCPYFLARHMLAFANVVVYNYQYMLDPKVESLFHPPHAVCGQWLLQVPKT